MDESWDADFDGQLKIPEIVRGTSDSVRNETQAARDLSHITAQLKQMLLTHYADIPKPLLKHAVAIVQASTTDENDEIYRSEAWNICRNEKLEVAGDSIEQVLSYAVSVRDDIVRSQSVSQSVS